jgi:hypothetical protein
LGLQFFQEWREKQEAWYPEDPYYFCLDHCFRYCIQGISEYPTDEGIEIYIDQDKQRESLGRELAQWHRDKLRKAPSFWRIAPDRPVSINYASSYEVLPLQAADIISHSTFSWTRASLTGATKESYLTTDSILAAMHKANCPLGVQFYDDAEMIRILRRGTFWNTDDDATK